jgi:hypothetical protein
MLDTRSIDLTALTRYPLEAMLAICTLRQTTRESSSPQDTLAAALSESS